MSVVCLVRPLLSPSEFNGYPLNLLILATCLRSRGHEVVICDYDLQKEIDPSWAHGGFAKRATTEILGHDPDFVGITSMCSNYALALDLAAELKSASASVHITFGGPHVSLCARETIERYPCVDSVVVGEGEITYPELVACVEEGGDLTTVAGAACRRDGAVASAPPRSLMPDLNLSPRPAYDLIDMSTYIRAATGSALEIYAGSGCPFTCTFCSTSIVWERKYRTMAPERIVGEMEKLHATYGATAFNLIHDNLTVDKKFVAAIADLIRERDLDIGWGFSSRVDTINRETIERVAAAGCNYIFFGVESGSAKIQKTMRKRLKLDQVRETIVDCVDTGIAPATSFILGFPDEDPDDVAQTIRLAFTCRVLGARRSFINLLSAYTGTPVMEAELPRLVFRRDIANSTMVAFLEEHHYPMIEADPFVFSNYYSLDYSLSWLDAADYADLVDCYTICLFRYQYSVSFIINDCEVDPLHLFGLLRDRMRALDPAGRNRLDLVLTDRDVRACVDGESGDRASALLGLDEALWMARTSMPEGLLYSAPVLVNLRNTPNHVAPHECMHHYLIKARGSEVQVSELPESLSRLYELQGMSALRFEAADREYLAVPL